MGCEICSRGEARRGRGLGGELVREWVALRGCVGVETRETIIATSYEVSEMEVSCSRTYNCVEVAGECSRETSSIFPTTWM
jgi:hypothetical protein